MVTVRSKALSDRRLVQLAKLAGYPGGDDEALGKMTRLWALCAEQQTNTPEVRHIRACLGPRGEEHLVESGLGDDKHRDPSLAEGVIRVRGCDETDWYFALLERKGQEDAGRARATSAIRDARGRFLPEPEPPPVQQEPASDHSPDLGSGSDPIRPELPDLGAITSAERARVIERAAAAPANRNRTDRRRRLHMHAWGYAGMKHDELRADGVDPNARNCWAGLPSASSLEAQSLFARIDELAPGDTEAEFNRAGEVIKNRVDVAAAEARRDKTLRWFIPARMWDAKSFSIAKDLSPEQAAQPRRHQPDDKPPAAPARRMRTL